MLDSLYRLRHELWIKVRLATPTPLQSPLQEAKEIALLIARPFPTLYEWQGQGRCGPLTVSYAGFEYAKPYLKSTLFVQEPTERVVGRFPFWRLGRWIDSLDADIGFVVADRRLISKLPRENALILPYRTRLTLDIRGEWEEVLQRLSRTVRKQELRLIRKYGYTHEVSHSFTDFEAFYRTMYRPTMQERHAELADLESFEVAYQYFRRGLLILIKRDDQGVAGALCYPEGRALYFIVGGVLSGDEQLIREGALAACYYWLIHWAHQQGHETVDFWGSKPYLGGLFSYKRKWGATVGVPSDVPQRIWMSIRRNTPAVSQYLKDNPCITLDNQGSLWGLIFTDDPSSIEPETIATWHTRYDTPGLNGLLIRSVSDLLSPTSVNLQ